MFSVITFDIGGMPMFCLGRGTGSGASYNSFFDQVPVIVVFTAIVPVAISAHRTCVQCQRHTNLANILAERCVDKVSHQTDQ